MKKLGVVIVAGGSGTRMGADVPKQFLRNGECLFRFGIVFCSTLQYVDISVFLTLFALSNVYFIAKLPTHGLFTLFVVVF